MISKLLRITICLAVVGGVFLTGVSSAGTRAETTVSIRAQGTDLSGFVDSPRPRRCADGRTIVLYKQLGTEQDPRNDDRIASDTAELVGDRYQWSTGNTGVYGRFYARARPTPDCRPDNSRTIRVRRTT